MEDISSLKVHSEVNQSNWKSELFESWDITQVFFPPNLDTYGLLSPSTPQLWACFDIVSQRKMNNIAWRAVGGMENWSLCILGCLGFKSHVLGQLSHTYIKKAFMYVNFSDHNKQIYPFASLLPAIIVKQEVDDLLWNNQNYSFLSIFGI